MEQEQQQRQGADNDYLVEEHIEHRPDQEQEHTADIYPSAVACLEGLVDAALDKERHNTSCHCQHERKHQIQSRIEAPGCDVRGIPQRTGVIGQIARQQ